MEHVEQISIQVEQLKKKLAWSWVYDVDKKLEEQNVKIEKLKNRIPTCQAKIDKQLVCILCVVWEYHIPYCALNTMQSLTLGIQWKLEIWSGVCL